MGTALLSVLAGHWRYAHINALRGDGINPGLLGMRGTVSEDAVRLAMDRIWTPAIPVRSVRRARVGGKRKSFSSIPGRIVVRFY
jgi:hypothetical protein